MGFYAMLFLLLGLVVATPVTCNLEVDALHAQRAAWSDPNNVLQSWDPTSVNPCTWFHITCNNNNSVVRVDLGSAGLSGPLVRELANLSNLQYLLVFGNNITGSIPYGLGNLTSLLSLGLQQNGLSGSIPPSLGNIKSLQYLRLNGNFLSGTIPEAVIDLIVTGNLVFMNVSDNYLSGTVRNISQQTVITIIQDQKANS